MRQVYRPLGPFFQAARWVGLVLALMLGHLLSHAQGLPGSAATTRVDTGQVVAELWVHAPQGAGPASRFWLGLSLRHAPEWHTYWRNPGDSGLPTQIELVHPPAGLQLGEPIWPLPQKLRAGDLTNYGYDGTVLLVVPVQVPPSADPLTKSWALNITANWLVCRLECIPQEANFQVEVPTQLSQAAHAAAFERVFGTQPSRITPSTTAEFAQGLLTVRLHDLPEVMRGQKVSVFPDTPEILASAAETDPRARQQWEGTSLTLALPLSALRQAEPRTLDLLLTTGSGPAKRGVWQTVTIAGPWPAALDKPLAPKVALEPSASVGWGFLLALAGALVGGLILNLMPCVLPVLALKVLAFARHAHAVRAHRVAGLAYSGGVLASFALLGAGLLAMRAAGEQLGWGFQLQSPAVVVAMALLFLAIGLNLLGWFEVGQILPSSWLSMQARHPVLDAALSGVLAVAVASPCTAPFMGASLGLALTLPAWQAMAIFLTLGLGLALPYLLASWWPALALRLPRPGPWMQRMRQWLAVPMFATVAWLLWVLAQQLGASPVSANAHEERWQAWSAARVERHLMAGEPVFVDFTAAWCVTCQINERTTLADADVLNAFDQAGVRLLRADWTRQDPAITEALRQLGRSGVPVYVLQVPGRDPQVFSEILSRSALLESLRQLPAPRQETRSP